MILGQIVAHEMVNKHMKFHKICFNTYKVIAKVKVCHIGDDDYRYRCDDNTSSFFLWKSDKLKMW